MRRRIKAGVATAVATLIAIAVSMTLIEAWVRLSWDPRRGTPGFYMSDPVLGQRLRPGYDGWFAGVPVKINGLGFRDPREYALAKPPGTFRILVLGDSVTFGHGTPYETTYPFALEQRLKRWRPEVKWEVWNLGVPGYNTAQELAYLREAQERYAPDFVIVGFFENDLADNRIVDHPGLAARTRSAIQRTMQRYLYSYELYRRVLLTVRFRLTTAAADQQRLAELDGEGRLLQPDRPQDAVIEDLDRVEFLDDEQVRSFTCPDKPRREADSLARRLEASSDELTAWRDALRGFHAVSRAVPHRLLFFINMAPRECSIGDRFVDGGSLDDDAAITRVLGEGGVPVVSSTRAFLHYRPSQMPGAGGHSIGAANLVKAQALFEFLRDRVLPTLLTPVTPSSAG